MRLVSSIALALAPLTACATVQVGTESGRPEIAIPGVSKGQVLNELVIEFSERGFFVADQNDFSVLFSKDSDDIATSMLFGSRYNSTPQWRVRCTTAEREGEVRLTAAIQIVTNPGTSHEKPQDMSKGSKTAVQVQQIFQAIQGRLAAPDAEDASGE